MLLLAVGAVSAAHHATAQAWFPELGDFDFDGSVEDDEETVWETLQPYTEWLIHARVAMGAYMRPPLNGECNDTGVTWSRARAVQSGGVQCDGTSFTIGLGADEGGQVTATWLGCPAFIDIELGHGKTVAKPGFRVGEPAFIPWQRQAYKADCAAATCEPDGMPTDLPTRVTHWVEEACLNGGGGGGSGPGTGPGDGNQ